MKETFLAINGRPGLYRLISHAKNILVVEALDETHKRLPIFASDKVISLSDISIYTKNGDVPLFKVLASVKEIEGGKVCSIVPRKASSKELALFLEKVLSDYDRERVHDNDVKKLIQWYNALIRAGINNFDELLELEQEYGEENTSEKH